MAQTIALSPTANAGRSDDIVVSAGPVVVTMYGAGSFSGTIERKIGSDWVPAGQWLSNSAARSVVITGPGTYSVVKQATNSPVGVAVDA